MSRGTSDTRRRGGRLRLLVVLALVAMVVASPFLFIAPAADDPATIAAGEPVDALVVLGGSPDVRLGAAVELVAGLPTPPDVLVLSVQYPAPVVTCGTLPELPRVPLRCFSPTPTTTAGEAVWVAEEVAERGWDQVVVVTSDTHVTRARVLVERCVDALAPDATVAYVAAETDVLSLRGLWAIVTEWPSLLGTPFDHQQGCR